MSAISQRISKRALKHFTLCGFEPVILQKGSEFYDVGMGWNIGAGL